MALQLASSSFEYAVSASLGDPRSYRDAISRPDAPLWLDTMSLEMSAHDHAGTWELVDRRDVPPGMKVQDGHWVVVVKYNADGMPECQKARWVLLGFGQHSGFDFFETFAGTAKMQTICAVLVLVAALDLDLHSFNVSDVFLNGDIDAEVYMEQPEGFQVDGHAKVCKLHKAIYGTRQGAHAWKQKLQQVLINKMSFTCIHSDASVLLPVFVDDGTFASMSTELTEALLACLQTFFKLDDLGTTSFLLGVEIIHDRAAGMLTLLQRQYVVDILDRFNMSDCKGINMPMVPGLRLSSDNSPKNDGDCECMRQIPYSAAVGALLLPCAVHASGHLVCCRHPLLLLGKSWNGGLEGRPPFAALLAEDQGRASRVSW